MQEAESATLEAISKSKIGSVCFFIFVLFHFGVIVSQTFHVSKPYLRELSSYISNCFTGYHDRHT